MARIEIDRLEIRVRNIPRETIGSIAEGLGTHILDRLDSSLNDPDAFSANGGPMMIDRLDAGVVRGGSESGSHDLQGQIAESIVRTITSSMIDPRSGSGSGVQRTARSYTRPDGIPQGRVRKQ